MITALDTLLADPAQAAAQQAAYAGDPNQFAALFAQAQANAAQGGQSAASTVPVTDPSALLAFQVAQLQASANATQNNSGSAAQSTASADQQAPSYDSAVLQNLNYQAALALSQKNAGAVNVLEMMINKQMQDMGLVAKPVAQATTAASASKSTAGTAKTSAPKNTAAKSATAATTSASSTAAQEAASNASTTSSASAALEDQVVSNASTVGVPSAEVASNAGTTGDTFANDDPLAGDTWQDQVDDLAFELETLLSGMDENDREAALAGMQGLIDDLAGLTAQT